MTNSDYLREFINAMLNEELTSFAANRAKFIKDKLEPHWKGLPEYKDIDVWLEKLAEVDPTTKKIYMPWLARMCISKPNENRTEDLNRVSDDLRAFETNKLKIANKNIDFYKSFQELFDIVAPFLAPKVKTKDDLEQEKKAKALEKVKAEIITVYAGPEGWIRIPTTLAASKFLGQNTRWCTASEKDNRFTYYAKDDNLFVVYDKASKKRSQLHIQSGQYADEADRNQGIKAVPEWAGKKILEYYKAHNPNLTMKQLMALQAFTDENLAKNTPHEELFDLFKQFGV